MDFHHPCHIVKAEDVGGPIKVLVKASTEGEDRQGEVVLKSAFADPAMQRSFAREGYYDYNHLTDILDKQMVGKSGPELVALQKAKVQAIIGYPDPENSLFVREDGVYSQGYLFADNEYVHEIRKGLESGWKGWGASISGLADPKDLVGNVFTKMSLRKIAIAPLQEVINPDTSIVLAKSKLSNILKGGADYYTPEQTGSPLPDSQNDDPVYRELCDRIQKLTRVVFESPIVQDIIAHELVEAIQRQALPVQHDPIVGFLTDKYGFDIVQAKEIANAILLNGGV